MGQNTQVFSQTEVYHWVHLVATNAYTKVLSQSYLADSLLGGEVFTVMLVLNGPVIPALVTAAT